MADKPPEQQAEQYADMHHARQTFMWHHMRERCLEMYRSRDPEVAALNARIAQLERSQSEWLCDVCRTVFPERKSGFDLSCKTAGCLGTLRPSSMSMRRLEERAQVLEGCLRRTAAMLATLARKTNNVEIESLCARLDNEARAAIAETTERKETPT